MAKVPSRATSKKAPAKAPKAPAKPPAKAPKAPVKAPAKAPSSILPEFSDVIEDCYESNLSITGPRDYVLRTKDGTFLHDVCDLVVANQLARALGARIKVFKRTRDGEVLMSYHGPGKWD